MATQRQSLWKRAGEDGWKRRMQLLGKNNVNAGIAEDLPDGSVVWQVDRAILEELTPQFQTYSEAS